MKLNWNFLGGGGGGAKQKTFHGGSMDIFWNCTLTMDCSVRMASYFLTVMH